MRNKKLLWNTASSLVYQVVVLICGFILPRLILGSFGSEINGLVNSITQFLAIIGFLDMGVGAVVRSSLYKPLAQQDHDQVSRIVTSANKFFQRLARILLVYVAVLTVVYPYVAQQEFDWLFTAGLIVVISINSFSQYYFGIVDTLCLSADQRGYVVFLSQTATVILNTAACAVLIYFGASIHLVKLATSLIYLARPLVIRQYVNRHYAINRKMQYTEEPIQQKWNGVAQHVAAVVLDSTDSIVLTVFSTLSNVSIYSVYYMVINGVKQLLLSATGGIQSLMGELWAKQELKELHTLFRWTEWAIHTGTTFVFGCSAVLLVPFVQVYTAGVADADYVQPLFALLLTLAHAGHCLRLPYNLMILAGGHYKQTQSNYIVATGLNIVISVITVKWWGLIGVAIGTLVAMCYQTFWMATYISNNLIHWPLRDFMRQLAVDVGTFAVAYGLTRGLPMMGVNYLSWFVLAVEVALIWLGVIAVMNLIFYREHLLALTKKVPRK